nr:beta-mannanase/endoglucanase A-like [Procambarus clarkii]
MARVTLTPVPMTRMTHTSAPTPITRVTPTPTPEPTARTTPTLSPTPTTRCCAWGHHTTDKDFTRERPLEQVVELICQESTAHGVGHTWNNRRNFLGVFWFIVTASLFILLLLLSARLSCDFVQRDVQSQASASRVV